MTNFFVDSEFWSINDHYHGFYYRKNEFSLYAFVSAKQKLATFSRLQYFEQKDQIMQKF